MGQIVTALMIGAKLNARFVKAATMDTPRGKEWIWGEALPMTRSAPPWLVRPYPHPPIVDDGWGAIGYPYALSGGSYPGAVALGRALSLLELGQTHRRPRGAALRRWEALEKWLLEEHGIKLPPPQILITQVEVG